MHRIKVQNWEAKVRGVLQCKGTRNNVVNRTLVAEKLRTTNDHADPLNASYFLYSAQFLLQWFACGSRLLTFFYFHSYFITPLVTVITCFPLTEEQGILWFLRGIINVPKLPVFNVYNLSIWIQPCTSEITLIKTVINTSITLQDFFMSYFAFFPLGEEALKMVTVFFIKLKAQCTRPTVWYSTATSQFVMLVLFSSAFASLRSLPKSPETYRFW